MSQAPAMPLWTDALIGDTTHLSAEEFGAYLLILIATWRNNGEPFADDDGRLARICRMPKARWTSKLRPALIGFFNLSDGSWRQKRLEKEWKYVAELSSIQSEKGKRSGEARRLKRNETRGTAVPPWFEPEGEPNANPQTHTHTQSKEEERGTAQAPLPGGYSFYGRIIRLKRQHFDDWRKTYHGIPDIVATLHAMDAYYDTELEGDDRKRWFIRCSTALDKKHQEAVAAKKRSERPLEERYPNEDPAARSKKPAEFGSDFVPAKEFSDDPLAPPWMRRRA